MLQDTKASFGDLEVTADDVSAVLTSDVDVQVGGDVALGLGDVEVTGQTMNIAGEASSVGIVGDLAVTSGDTVSLKGAEGIELGATGASISL
eukprot:COSAG04_NODE_28424_length_275_cov_3.244318_1_plen_91_part_11